MKKLLIIIVTAITVMQLTAWEATWHENDAYHQMTWEEERKYLNEYPEHLREFVEEICREYLVPIKYLYRLHFIESKLGTMNIRYESNGTMSLGYGQLNTGSMKYFQNRFNNGRHFNPHNDRDNIRISAMYLRDLYERLDGDWIGSACAYNWGIGNFRSGKEVPLQCIEYGFTVVWGTDYIDCVQIIKGAVRGIL
jgi:hypothetical protein